MKNFKTKSCATLILAILAISIGIQFQTAYSAIPTAQEKTVAFMSNVLGFDMSRYSVTSVSTSSSQPDELKGLTQEDLTIFFDSSAGTIKVFPRFVNGILVDCYFYDATSGSAASPIYSKAMPTDVIDLATTFLEQYKAYTGATYIQQMVDMIKGKHISTTTTSVTIENDLKMRVVTENTTHTTLISWGYYVNDIDFQKGVSLTFINGNLLCFLDWWNLYQVGNTNIDISKDKAISIAWEEANKVTTVTLAGAGNITFGLKKEPDNAYVFGATRENLTAYPFWYIHFTTDKSYDSIDGVEVGIWADTGKVEYVTTTGYHGNAPGDPIPPVTMTPGPIPSVTPPPFTPPTEPSALPGNLPAQNQDSTTTPPSTFNSSAQAAIIVAALAIVIAVIVVKKRSN